MQVPLDVAFCLAFMSKVNLKSLQQIQMKASNEPEVHLHMDAVCYSPRNIQSLTGLFDK